MADKNAKNAEVKDANPAQSGTTFVMPKGATKVQAAKLFYWFPYIRADGQPAIQRADIEKGGRPNTLHCEVVLRQERHDSPKMNAKTGAMERQFFYMVKILQGVKAVDRDKVVHDMRPGDVIVVDERHQLKMLEKFLNTAHVVEAVVVPEGKIDGGGGSVLLFDVHAVPTERTPLRLPASTAASVAEAAAASSAPTDDIPFS
jgi:hypothetical protein